MGVPTLIMARTDADSAHLLTSDIDPRDREFLTGERTAGRILRHSRRPGFGHRPRHCLRALCRPDLVRNFGARIWKRRASFAEAVHAKYPGKMLAYNCSPSFNWKKKLDDATIARFQTELAAMGYKFQFITLAGFHALNLSMFELARGYKQSGMSAYSRLQEKEFASDERIGYEAVKHQRFVGTGYFDMVTQVIAGGNSSITALAGSTEAEQFDGRREPKSTPSVTDRCCCRNMQSPGESSLRA